MSHDAPVGRNATRKAHGGRRRVLCLALAVALAPAGAFAQTPAPAGPPAPPASGTGCREGMTITADTRGNCCWPGQVWSAGKQSCVGVPQCPAPLVASGEECVPAAAAGCRSGQTITADTAGHCCWAAQAWSQSRQACVGIPQCPPGSVARVEVCVAADAPPPAPVDVASQPCTLGAGNYCGGNGIKGDPSTLYRCEGTAQSGQVTVVERCAAACQVMPAGQSDRCPTPPGAAPLLAPPVTASPAAASRTHRKTSALVYVGFIGAGVSVAVGLVAGGNAIGKTNKLASECGANKVCPATSDYGTANTLANVANVAFVAAGAFLVLGVIGLATGGKSQAPAPDRAASVWVGPGSLGVTGAF